MKLTPLCALLWATTLLADQPAPQPTPAPTAPAASPATTPAAPEKAVELPASAQLTDRGRFKQFFHPFRTERVSLSPDGKYLAYTLRDGGDLFVLVSPVDHLDTAISKVLVANNATSTGLREEHQAEDTPAQIHWMQWVSPTRLVVETNRAFSRSEGSWQTWRGCIVAFNADGSKANTLVTPMDLAEMLPAGTDAAAFGTTRRSDTFSSRIESPDRAMGSAALPPQLVQEEDNTDPASVKPQTASYVSQPRTMHITSLDPERPGAVRLTATGGQRAEGTHTVAHFTLDATTGKLTELTSDVTRESRLTLLDRQGRIRLEVPGTLSVALPHHYDYRGPKGADRAKPLADFAPAGLDFTLSTGNFFGERAVPVGFDEDPNLLYYAANAGRDTLGLYSLNLTTHQRGSLAIENPGYDLIAPPLNSFLTTNPLIFDRYEHKLAGVTYDNARHTTAWLQPDLREVQTYFERYFPGHAVELLDWDQAHQRYLLATQGPGDAGGFYLFDRGTAKVVEFARRAPWIDAAHTHATLPFSFATKDGTRLGGLITVPRQPRVMPIPLVFVCPETPWQRVRSDFRTEVHALADMGFAVVQLNGRGAWGLGRKHREAITAGYDLVQIEDLVSSIDELQKLFRIDPAKVALLGTGHGGFIALRAVQDHPKKFRCAIALNAPVDLNSWLKDQYWQDDNVGSALTRAWFGDTARLAAAPLVGAPEKITRPLLLLNYGGSPGAERTGTFLTAKHFASAVQARGVTVDFDELTPDYMRGLPDARAAVFGRIEDFLNTHLYNYTVKLKELKEVP